MFLKEVYSCHAPFVLFLAREVVDRQKLLVTTYNMVVACGEGKKRVIIFRLGLSSVRSFVEAEHAVRLVVAPPKKMFTSFQSKFA